MSVTGLDTLGAALQLLERIAQAPASEFGHLQRKALEITDALASLRRPVRGDARRQRERLPSVDSWMLDIIRSTQSPQARETLLQVFTQRYRSERHIDHDDVTHEGPWLFTFEHDTVREGSASVQPGLALGVHPKAFQELCAQHLPQWMDDAFLGATLLRNEVDVRYAAISDPSPLFDRLLNITHRFGGERNYFVQACLLPGDRDHPGVGIFLIYPNLGDAVQPEPPSTLRQDQRLLVVLEAAWRQLEHQVRALATFSERNRRDVLNLIAPGLMHHELGFVLRTLYGQAYELDQLLVRAQSPDAPAWLAMALDYVYTVGKLTERGHRVTDVFNNLDKRGALETYSLDQVVEDIHVLMHHRLGAAGTELRWTKDILQSQRITTDVVLLQQALLNIVINALNAITEAVPKIVPPRWIQIDLSEAGSDHLALDICNSGPPIPAKAAERIFERGYTTRTEGHGQGLYLVGLIAVYLRGNATLLGVDQLPHGCHVGFRLRWRRQFSAHEGLARASI